MQGSPLVPQRQKNDTLHTPAVSNAESILVSEENPCVGLHSNMFLLKIF